MFQGRNVTGMPMHFKDLAIINHDLEVLKTGVPLGRGTCSILELLPPRKGIQNFKNIILVPISITAPKGTQ